MPSFVRFVIASLIWGSTFWAITLELGHVPPAVSIVYRFALAAAALFVYCLVRGERLRLPWRTQRWMMLQRPGRAEWLGMLVCRASVAWALRAPVARPAPSVNVNKAVETP
jgi:drug/metabolite transporter (DMT)-like permease